LEKALNYNKGLKKKFITFVYENKEFIEGNRRLKHLLTIYESDDDEVRRNKKLFKMFAELFMKKFVL